jgi:catechol 2,3-dioxygenase-like lactoylglutathione lyase family enzyme
MRITRIELTATDLNEVAHFYGTTLGLPTKRTPDSITVTVGWSTIGFTRGETRAGDIHIAFTIPRNQIEEARAWLSARTPLSVVDGIEVLVLDSEPWRSQSLYFRGPDGIVLELITRANLTNDSAAEFSGRSLLNVSEVGLAARDVPAVAAELRQLGIESFGDGGDEFRPIGDDEGLFILVTDGRTWFSAPDAQAHGGPALSRVEATTPGSVERPGWTVAG